MLTKRFALSQLLLKLFSDLALEAVKRGAEAIDDLSGSEAVTSGVI